MSELKQRIITAMVLAAGAAYWMFYTDGMLFALLTFSICMLAWIELFNMLDLSVPTLYIMTLAIPSLVWIWQPDVMPLSILLLIPLVLWMMIYVFTHRSNSSNQSFSYFAYAQWMALLIACFGFSLIQAHQLEGGVLFLSGAFLGVWAADIGAYFVGKAMGKNKLCPSISPGKSVEGFVGGCLLGTAVATVFWIQMIHISTLTAWVLAVVLVLVSVIGDLGESALKRAVGVKDSGKMLPGHGGLLDRIDALLPSIPVVVTLWLAIA